MARYKNFVFTLNNWEDKVLPDPANFNYLVWGYEIAPETGTPHLQGFCQFKNNKSLRSAIRLLPGCHVEIARGTATQARDYAIKGGEFEEWGEFCAGQGTRTDLEEAIATIDANGSTMNVNPSTYVKFHAGLEKYALRKQPKRNWMPEVIVLWGETGTGKSRRANEMAPNAYWKPPGDEKWWDTYNGEDDIIIDDFASCDWSYRYLLRLCDRYPMMVQTKGGWVQMRCRRIIITTNENPTIGEYHWQPELMRRIANLHEVT